MRRDWTVAYNASEIADAAAQKATHHRARADHYTDIASSLEADLRERGVELRTTPMSGGERMTAVLDNDLASQLATARGAAAQHQGWLNEYAALRDMMARAAERGNPTFDATVDDYTFLFGPPRTAH